MQEGLATVCLVGSSCTLQRARIEASMPRKRGAAAAGYDKALDSFHAKVGTAGAGRCLAGHNAMQQASFCTAAAACTGWSSCAVLLGGLGGQCSLPGPLGCI